MTHIQAIFRSFGVTVRSHRKAQGITLPDLASVAGISKGHLSEIEHGKKNVSLETINKLSLALRVKMSDLLK